MKRSLDDLTTHLFFGHGSGAAGAWQSKVGNDYIERKSLERLEGRLAVGGLGDLVAFVRKSFSYNTSERFLIVYEEHVWHRRQNIDRFLRAVKNSFGLHA